MKKVVFLMAISSVMGMSQIHAEPMMGMHEGAVHEAVDHHPEVTPDVMDHPMKTEEEKIDLNKPDFDKDAQIFDHSTLPNDAVVPQVPFEK